MPTEKCETKKVKVPKQEKEHKKKCLLADDNSLPATTTPASYPTPTQSQPEPTYPAAPAPVSTQTPKPTYVPAPQPSYLPAPQPSFQPQRTGRFNNQVFGQRQPLNTGFGRRSKSFRQQPITQSIRGRFRG